MKKKVLGIIAAASMLFAVPVSAATDVVNTTPLPIQGGALSIEGNQIAFSQVSFENGKSLKSSAVGNIVIDDSRGNGAGWNVKISSTNFTQSVPDPTASGKQLEVSIPVSLAKVTAGTVTSVAGAGVDGIVNNATTPVSLLATPQTLLSAEPGKGMGTYTTDLNFNIDIPETVNIVTADSGSKYKAGDTIGVFAGTYTATVTYTISTGP